MGTNTASKAQAKQEVPYVFAVRLAAEGYPPWAKFAPPRGEQPECPESGICVLLARLDVLVRHLALAADPTFPNRYKLQVVLKLVAKQKPIAMPILQPTGFGELLAGFRFQTGRHRVLMLHELGATSIPVVVPAVTATEVLSLIG